MAISAELGPHMEQFVAKLVTSGRYNSKSEVLRDGLRLLEERQAKLEALDKMIAEGLTSLDRGEGKPGDEVFDRLEAKYRSMVADRS